MVAIPSLYDHQMELVERARESLRRHRQIVVCAPTGFGKTRVAKHILAKCLEHSRREGQSGYSLVAVYGRGLVDNLSNSLKEDPRLPHGVIMSKSETRPGCHIQIASIDSLLSWYCEGNEYNTELTFDLVIVDETHNNLPKVKVFLELHDAKRNQLGLSPAYVIGLSATPQCKGLADVYNDIVHGPAPGWLIEHGYASPFLYMAGQKADLSVLVRRGSTFTEASKAAATDGLHGDFIRDWLKYAQGRPTIGYFPNLSQAEAALGLLNAAGIRAGFVHNKTADDERRAMLSQLEQGELDYLCNVGIFERGTNIPCVSCVQLCVVVGDVPRYLQMIGRGSRRHASKRECLVLDHGNNVHRHGFWEDERIWTLDQTRGGTSQVRIRPSIECPQCGVIYRGGACRECGYEPTRKERKAQGLKFDGTELREVKASVKSRKAISDEQILVSNLYRTARSGRTWNQCLHLCRQDAKEHGKRFRVPKHFEIAGTRYESIPMGSSHGQRRVSTLYPFLVKEST